jgi:hypothetical protein
MFPTPQEIAMTRNLITKLVVVALAIASLGLASTASAADPMQNVDPATPAAPAVPAQPANPATPADPAAPAKPATLDQNAQKVAGQADKEMEPTAEEKALQERFNKECPQGGNSPSQFCKDFARGVFNKRPPTSQERESFKMRCLGKGSGDQFCKDYREGLFGCDEFVQAPKCKNGKGGSSSSSSNGKGGHNGSSYGHDYDNGSYGSPAKKAEKVLNKQLPFTGLEIWQLGLLGLVLSGGGLGVRRLLAS